MIGVPAFSTADVKGEDRESSGGDGIQQAGKFNPAGAAFHRLEREAFEGIELMQCKLRQGVF